MKPARTPQNDKTNVRLLVIEEGEIHSSSMGVLPEYLRAGDLLVVNDAATLPASLRGMHRRDGRNNQVELRLTSRLNGRVWQAVALGAGDWHTPTEERPSPPLLLEGEQIEIAPNFHARVMSKDGLSNRLLNLEFNLSGEDLWRSLYRHGKPVQYSYMNEELNLWSVQNIYSSRPWAAEMPSAGHAITWELLIKLIRKGIEVVPLTHGAGLSSTGDIGIDEALPLEEKFEIPAATMEAVRRTKTGGGRVIVVGTSVVRALESADLGETGVTGLKIGPGYERKIVDGLLTGTHDASESHYQLLRAFLDNKALGKVTQYLEEQNYLTHEFGDMCLILPVSPR